MEVELNKNILKLCEEFADARMEGSQRLYRKRGEQQLKKIRKDIVTGAMAEFAVQEYVQRGGNFCSDPDLTVLDAAAKSYEADLKTPEFNLHVKSQDAESAERWGLSWLFQKRDPITKFPKLNDVVIFCRVNGNCVTVMSTLFAQTLLTELLLTDLRLSSYGKTKKAVYYDELLASGVELFIL